MMREGWGKYKGISGSFPGLMGLWQCNHRKALTVNVNALRWLYPE